MGVLAREEEASCAVTRLFTNDMTCVLCSQPPLVMRYKAMVAANKTAMQQQPQLRHHPGRPCGMPPHPGPATQVSSLPQLPFPVHVVKQNYCRLPCCVVLPYGICSILPKLVAICKSQQCHVVPDFVCSKCKAVRQQTQHEACEQKWQLCSSPSVS